MSPSVPSTRTLVRSLAVALAATTGLALTACTKDTPKRAPSTVIVTTTPTPAPSESTTPSDTGTPTPTVSSAAYDIAKPPEGMPPTTMPQDGIEIPLNCPDTSDNQPGAEGAGDGERGAYLAVRQGQYLALVDRVAQQTLWCQSMGLGSATEDDIPPVGSESSVGRPGYQPSMDGDTLQAAAPTNDPPTLTAIDGRLWVVQKLVIRRPEIQSQAKQKLFAYMAFDETGKAVWLKSFTDPAAYDDTTYQIDNDGHIIRRVAKDTSEPTMVTLTPIDVATGTPGPPISYLTAGMSSTRNSWSFASTYVATDIAKGDKWAMTVYDLKTGKPKANAPWVLGDRLTYQVSGQHLLIVGPDAYERQESRVVVTIDLTSGAVKTIQLKRPVRECTSADNGLFVCRADGDTGTIAGIDAAKGVLAWQWNQGDPHPDTRVPRNVPRDMRGWNGYLYALDPDNKTYLIDAKTGNDLPTPVSLDLDVIPYGKWETSGQSVRVWPTH